MDASTLDRSESDSSEDTLMRSTEDMSGEWYHSMSNSCYTACVDLLNDVLGPEQSQMRTNFLKMARC
jgi:hypothetical protein